MNTIKEILKTKKLSGFRGSPEGHYGGYWIQKLEESFREYFNIKYAVAMNSATAALHSACVACGQGEFIVSPFTFSASASCVLQANSQPRFADVNDITFTISPGVVIDRITDKTRAIIPVHLCGHPADLNTLTAIAKKFNLKIIEDACQAIGAFYNSKKVGTIGDCGIFSFNQSKHINTGEGGMLITNDAYIARVARAMRNHGEVSDPELGMFGWNYRMCEIEASLAYEQFLFIDENIEKRNELTDRMTAGLKDIPELDPPVTMPWCYHSFYTYAMKYHGKDKREFQRRMLDEGVYFGGDYVKPLNLNPIFKDPISCTVAEKLYNTIIVTDIFKPPMKLKEVDKIIEKVKKCLK